VVLSSVDTSEVSAKVPDDVAFPVMRVFEEIVVEESVVEESVALVPKTNAPLPVSSESSPAIPADVVKAVKAPAPLPLIIPVSDVAPVPPLPTESADASVSTPADENVDVAVDPKYAWCAEKSVEDAVP
jgi:hypothetical protein